MAIPDRDTEIAMTTPSSGRKISHYATPVKDDELEFIRAIKAFQDEMNVPFPSWSEVLQVLKNLGYHK